MNLVDLFDLVELIQLHTKDPSTSSYPPPTQSKSNLIQSKLSFAPRSVPPPIPTQAPNSNPPSTPTPPLNDDHPISFQHKFSSSFPTDSQWLGLRIHCKSKHVARLWSQNINGIKRTNNFLQFAECIEALTQYEIDYFAFTETNLNSHNAYVKNSIDAITRHVLPSSRFIMSSTIGHDHHESFQYGGTLSISHGLLSSRVASTGQDKFGRYSWTHFFGKNSTLKYTMSTALANKQITPLGIKQFGNNTDKHY